MVLSQVLLFLCLKIHTYIFHTDEELETQQSKISETHFTNDTKAIMSFNVKHVENNLYSWKHKEASTNRTFGNQFLTCSLNEKLFFNVEVLRKWGLDGINYEKENNYTLQILHLKFINW